jgi:N-acetyl-anhydromuramyl-L-alanine amidase AmpD
VTLGPGGEYILPPLTQRPTPNQSSRQGAGIIGVVMHVTQGSYGGAVSWLCNPQSQASAHIVLREDGNEATQLVHWGEKAWHAVAANPHFIGIEMAGFYNHESDAQLHSAARIVGYLCHHFGIPAVWNVKHGGAFTPGITRHADLGLAGGGHFLCPMTDEARWQFFIALCQHEYTRGGYLPHWGVD